jgi:hypothetical protein
MIYLLSYYLAASFFCLWTGLLLNAWLPDFSSRGQAAQKPLVSYLITGLVGLTACGQWLALLMPLDSRALTFTLALLLLLSIFRWRQINSQLEKLLLGIGRPAPFLIFCLASLLLMVLVLNAGPSLMDDTASYHIQMVKWLKEFGTVKGIANLHLRFGFNSSWFASIALLSPETHRINSYFALNGLLSLWVCQYLLKHILCPSGPAGTQSAERRLLAGFGVLLLCLVNWPMIRGNAGSSGYDFISAACLLVLFFEFWVNPDSAWQKEWVIWPCFLFTIRMINFPLLLIPLACWIVAIKNGKTIQAATLGIFSLLLVFPFLARNLLLSGYPLYPLTKPDFFGVDWKADPALVGELKQYVKYFNRVNPGEIPMRITRTLAFPDWILPWYRHLFRQDQLLVNLSLLSWPYLWFRRRVVFAAPGSKFFAGVMLLQLISWFWVAPDPRFVYGPLLFFVFAALQDIPVPTNIPWRKLRGGLMLLLSVLVLVYATEKVVRDERYRNFIWPLALPVPAERELIVDSIAMHIPEKVLDNWNPRCYDLPLPCLYRIDPRLQARGSRIADGFRIDRDRAPAGTGEYFIR